MVHTKQTIEKSSVERYTIKNKELSLDPFRVTLEGNKVDVSCWNTVGTHYWGAPGEKGIKHFLTSIDFSYWSGKLFYEMTDNTLDEEATLNYLKERVKNLRLEGYISREVARTLWDYFVKAVHFSNKRECELWAYERLYNELETELLCLNKVSFYGIYERKDVLEHFNPWEGGVEIFSGCDPHLYHMWFKGWLPFVECLCEELGIEYKESSYPEKPDYVRI